MNQLLTLVLLFISYAHAAPLGRQEEWNAISDPLLMGAHFETRFHVLPQQGKVNSPGKFWSGDYWALNKGLINKRWNAQQTFSYSSPAKHQVLRMTPQELSQLSPSEKFDLLNGHYDYPLKNEVHRYADPSAKGWEGICHGWAPAAMNHKEPTPKTLVNPDGVMIPFGSSDIKALISYYYAYPYQVNNTHQVGRRCFSRRMTTEDDCQQDLNAGAFHIILANKVGLDNEGFIADLDRFDEVWNHPIMAFESKVTNERGDRIRSAPGTVRTMRVRTKVYWLDGTGNYWDPIIGTKHQKISESVFDYVLEIDRGGQIVGGLWRSKIRPDFLWIKRSPRSFTGDYARLAELLND